MKPNLPTSVSLLILILAGLLFTYLLLPSDNNIDSLLTNNQSQVQVPVITEENGRQIINILARGGYHPGQVEARSGQPTTLRLHTQNTYDCSVAFTIPALKINQMLPLNGETNIELPAQEPGTTLLGTCSMGMYNLKITFQ